MNKTLLLLAAIVALSAVPVFAQGPFTDVPADHWAYDAANQLQKDGVLIGYPDGTFQGKRTITRYEFAVAIARLAQMMPKDDGGQPVNLSNLATKDELKAAIAGIKMPDTSNLATKSDVDAIRKMVDEFKDEIAALGVDVDALKRDVAAMGARVDALEAEQKRVRFTGDTTVFAIAEDSTSANNAQSQAMVDMDQRTAVQPNDSLIRNIGLVKDFDLKIAGRVNNCITANATINYGDYLNYVAYVDDYIGGARPTSKTSLGPTATNPNADSLTDAFFPYYLLIDAALGKGSVTMGRFPLQFTPYTLRKIDVDSYTTILKTDDGNYPVDGAKVAWNFGGVDLTLFAVKNDENTYLVNGLTGQPTIPGFVGTAGGVLHQITTGHAVGGLNAVTQTAGVRTTLGIPCNGTVGLTFYQAWDQTAYNVASNFDQARVYGADLAIPVPWVDTLSFQGSWTRSDTITSAFAPAGVDNVDYGNIAWDGKFSGNIAALNASAGYKSIGRNFAAAGAWDKIGRWTNPTDVKGPYADFNYPILDNLKIDLNGEFLTIKDTIAAGRWGAKDDTLTKAELGIKWGFTKSNALDVAYQMVRFNDKATGRQNASENYLTVGLAHQLNPNAGVKVGYQFISYDDGTTGTGPYNADYRGGLGVVQFGVTF